MRASFFMFRFFHAALALALLVMALSGCAPRESHRESGGESDPLTVFAAASLTDALTEVAAAYEAETGQTVRLSFAASGAVARQIEAGAPAQVVLLADRAWMQRLVQTGRVQDDPLDLLRNRLVVIAPADAALEIDPFAPIRDGRRLALGDPESVPAGAYARAWLEASGRWPDVQDHIVYGADVRAVRAFVARGEAPRGIVYLSDATGQNDVKIVYQPPASEQPDIVYPAALTTGAGPPAEAFLTYLRSPSAMAVFRRHGFEPAA